MPGQDFIDDKLTPTQWMRAAIHESYHRVQSQMKKRQMDSSQIISADDDEHSNKEQGNDLSVTEEPRPNHMNWLDGRVVLFISDSIDRYNIQWFCSEFRDRHADPEAKFQEGKASHSVAACVVPSLNLTLLHWHLAGMTTYMPKWWWDSQNINDVPFEQRWNNTWNETFDALTSVNGKGPDLVIWQSNVWDRKNWLGTAKEHYGEKSQMAKYERPLVWDEVRFYAARVKKLLRFLRERLGEDVPMMLRTVTLDKQNMAKDVQTYEMDRINRVVGERFGVEPFEWGKIIAGHADLYRDSLHPGHGASSWLWSDMMLEYLARAVGAGTRGGARPEREPYFDGWDACHDQLMR